MPMIEGLILMVSFTLIFVVKYLLKLDTEIQGMSSWLWTVFVVIGIFVIFYSTWLFLNRRISNETRTDSNEDIKVDEEIHKDPEVVLRQRRKIRTVDTKNKGKNKI